MSTSPNDYWRECMANAAEECQLQLTTEQLKALADAAEGAHECYGLAFYSPPSTDRISQLEREHQQKVSQLEREYSTYRERAEEAVRQALGQRRDAMVSIGEHGDVFRHGGRTERIQ